MTFAASAVDALRYRDFRLLWMGRFLTGIGSGMQALAVGWFVVEIAVRDGTPELAPIYLGLVGASRAVPGLAAGLVAGTLADRFERRGILLVAQSTNCLIAGVLSAMVFADRATIPFLMACAGAAAAVSLFDGATRVSMMADLVPRHTLASAVGLSQTGSNLSLLVGPLLGGLLIGPIGVGGLLACSGGSFLAVVLVVVAMRPVAIAPGARAASGGILASIREGFAYVWGDPTFRPLFALFALSGLLVRPYQQLLPAFVHETLHAGATELSWLLGAVGLGMFVGAIGTSTLGSSVQRRGLGAIAAATGTGAAIAVFGLERSLLPAVLVLLVAAVTQTLHDGFHVTTYQLMAANHLRGRVVAASMTVITSATSLGALLLGTIASIVGTDVAFTIGGSVMACIGIVFALKVGTLRAPVHIAREREAEAAD